MAIDLKKFAKIETIMKLSMAKRVAILAVINVVLIGIIHQALIASKYAEFKNLTATLNDLVAKVESQRQIAANIPKFQKEKEELEARLDRALAQLPNAKEIPNLLDSISLAARTSGLGITTFQPKEEVPKGFYAEVPVDMDVTGGYANFYAFCGAISKLPRIVNIGKLDVTTPSGDFLDKPEIKVKFLSTTFRFVSEAENAANAAKAAKEQKK